MYFGQDNPHDQLVALIQAIWGQADNLEEGIVEPENAAKEVKKTLQEMQSLLKHVKGTKWKP